MAIISWLDRKLDIGPWSGAYNDCYFGSIVGKPIALDLLKVFVIYHLMFITLFFMKDNDRK